MTYDIPAPPDPKYIGVLDHGFVRLLDHMGDDLAVVRAARNSHDAAWRAGDNEQNDAKLLRYLMKNRHSTPFEVVEVQFEIQAPIFVLRQWHRHRTWTYNEVSARYTELPELFYVPHPTTVGTQSTTNKQGRDQGSGDPDRRFQEVEAYIDACKEAFALYRDHLNAGWPRELARCVLPLSTYSKMFAKVDLHNLLHFIGLRIDGHAQYEIRVYAQAMLDLIRPIVPESIAAWEAARGH